MKNMFKMDSGTLNVGRSKAKMAFDLLEKEMETLSNGELRQFKGGGGWDPPTDCVFQTLSYISGQQNCYQGSGYYSNDYDMTYGAGSSGGGVSVPDLGEFVGSHFSLNYAGTSASSMQNAVNNGQSVFIVMNNGSGNYHAVAYDGTDSSGNIMVWDEQNGEGYTITESQIAQTWGLN